ncbi:MAG: S8 family serine peptidase [Thermomicrobiales bacterium]
MSRLCSRPLALLLGITLAAATAHAVPPRQPGEEPDVPAATQPNGGPPILVYDNLNSSARPAYATDHIVVRFGPAVSAAMRRQITWSLGGRDYVQAEFGDFGRVPVRPGEDPQAVARRFRSNRDVEMAEVDWLAHAVEGRTRLARDHQLAQATAARTRSGGVEARARQAGTPRDGVDSTASTGPAGSSAPASSMRVGAAQDNPGFLAAQWHLERIRTQQAETLNPTRGAGVIVAVIDTGVGLWNGASCQNNIPRDRGLDLNGTRFVAGRDFVDNDNQALDEGSGDAPLAPRFGHGTFVATVIAAAVDNGVGGRGVAPGVSIMPVRVLGRDGFGNFSDIAEGINFAVANGADVINMSLGGNITPDQWNGTPAAAAVRNAHAAGVVLVAATGNEADTADPPSDVGFPARDPNVIAVGATRFNDNRASYSNFGPGVDIMAPGGENPFTVVNEQTGARDAILSPSFVHCPGDREPCDGVPTVCSGFFSTGTSFAAPQVAAGAAMLKALGVEDPDVIRTLLQNGARDIGAQGFDSETGHGLLDLFGAHRGFGFSFE